MLYSFDYTCVQSGIFNWLSASVERIDATSVIDIGVDRYTIDLTPPHAARRTVYQAAINPIIRPQVIALIGRNDKLTSSRVL